MTQTLEAANRKIFSLKREALHLHEENKKIKVRANQDIDYLEEFIKEHEKGVSRKKKTLEITIIEKNDFIRYLQEKLNAKEDTNPGNEVATEVEVLDLEEEHAVNEEEGETI